MIQRFARENALPSFFFLSSPPGWKKPCSWVGTRVFDFRYARTLITIADTYFVLVGRQNVREQTMELFAVAQLLIVARVHAVEQAGGEKILHSRFPSVNPRV